ncbi:hypothetical protein DSM25558_2835 [Agrobacterium sp. DSM 25558]|uniref:Uncharacterized protein n=2 Tax=Agrobacterium TaxID=357 RepID=A0A135NYE5_9HYPH|nr:hypothetical protein ATO67_14345 [Agrobacterium bohemicum]SCX21050.1 hypothetical protein DSM25558_2835 [Agrobacterium sp. DSM 25558]SCX31450.1 hypothetical protein DSM25559_3714 [Agrobacterium rosae]
MSSLFKTWKPRPASISVFADQPITPHRCHPAQPSEGDVSTVLPYQSGSIKCSVAATGSTFYCDDRVAHLTQPCRQVECR